jgi:hypothetical protein
MTDSQRQAIANPKTLNRKDNPVKQEKNKVSLGEQRSQSVFPDRKHKLPNTNYQDLRVPYGTSTD